MGDVLRGEVKTGSKQGLAIAEMIKEGKIVPAQVTIDLLKAAISTAPQRGFVLIDGFPRSIENLDAFEAQIGTCALTLFLVATSEIMQERLLERGHTSGRTDDNVETIKKRFETFNTQVVPVVAALKKKTIVIEVDASGSVENIAAVIAAEVQKFI